MFARMAGALNNGFNDRLNRALSVIAAQRVMANDALESDNRHCKQTVWQIQQLAKLRVVRFQVQLVVKHAQAIRQVVHDRL